MPEEESTDLRDLINGALDKVDRERRETREHAAQVEAQLKQQRADWLVGRMERLRNGQRWLREHFRADQKEDTLVDPACAAVVFSDERDRVQKALVGMRAYGFVSPWPIEYTWVDAPGSEPYWMCTSAWCRWYGVKLCPTQKGEQL